VRGLLRGELLKAVTTRTLLGYVATGLLYTLTQVLITTQVAGSVTTLSDKKTVIGGAPIILLLFGLVGAAGEYRHRTAAPAALVAGRDRGQLLLVRVGAYALVGLAIAAAMSALALALGLPLLSGRSGPALGGGDIARVVGGSLGAAALATVMGAAVGALLRNQVAGVTGVLVLSFMITPLLESLHNGLSQVTPPGVAMVVAQSIRDEMIPQGAAALVLVGWTLPLLIAAVVAERRRDLG
jgi:hypothetical protein